METQEPAKPYPTQFKSIFEAVSRNTRLASCITEHLDNNNKHLFITQNCSNTQHLLSNTQAKWGTEWTLLSVVEAGKTRMSTLAGSHKQPVGCPYQCTGPCNTIGVWGTRWHGSFKLLEFEVHVTACISEIFSKYRCYQRQYGPHMYVWWGGFTFHKH